MGGMRKPDCVKQAHKKSPATFAVLSSWKEDRGADCYFLVSSSLLWSATPEEAQQLLRSPSSGSLSSGKTCTVLSTVSLHRP